MLQEFLPPNICLVCIVSKVNVN